MSHRLRLAAAALLVNACAVDTSTAPPPPGSLAGSYDLLFGAVVVTPDQSGFGGNGQLPVSSDKHVRLDLRANGAGYDAVLAPEWEAPSAMTAQLSAGRLTLTGNATLNGSGVHDSWSTISLKVSGTSLGPFDAKGVSTADEGDVVFMQNVTATGGTSRASAPPQLRASGEPSGPPGVLLPWDAVVLEARAPVDTSAWRGKTTLTVGSVSPTLLFEDLQPSDAAWVGGTQLRARAASWDGLRGAATLATLVGVPDRDGRVADAMTAPLAFLDVGGRTQRFDFAGTDAVHGGMWGKASVVSGGACDSNGCMEIGPTDATPCSINHDGFAARLDATGKSQLVVRYRALEGNEFGQSAPLGPPVMEISITTPGAATGVTDSASAKTFTDLGSSTKLRWDTGWLTERVSLPAGAQEIGVAINPFGGYGCMGGPAMIPIAIDLYVDSVTLE